MFTKGEWIWYNGCSWWRLGTKEGQGKIDTLIMYPTIDSDGHPNIVISEENRNLISAAPDLYEACKEALLCANAFVLASGGKNKVPDAHNDLIEMLKQAINKAEGKDHER